MTRLPIRAPDDFHLHARRGERMHAYLRRSAACFARALVMPNVEPPPRDAESLSAYARELRAAAPGLSTLLSFKLLPGMSGRDVAGCYRAGAIAGKYYPAGSTTNSADGPRSPDDVEEALESMEELGIALSVHGEDPDAPALERERAFLPVVDRVVNRHRRLRVVLEHVSTREGVEAVKAWPDRVGATLTAHHLAFSIDDLLGDGLDPRLYCKPPLGSRADREALRAAAISHPRFFFGSDSAPHPAARKLGYPAPAGCYTAPVALCLLAREFDAADSLEALEAFVSERGADFYGLSRNDGTIELAKESWTVPEEVDGCLPPLGGRELGWRVARGIGT